MQIKTKAILSHGLVILNLLFPFVYVFILISWFINRHSDEKILRISINEAFVLSTISTFIFSSIVAATLLYFGFKSTFVLIAGEIYYMFLVPLFFIPAIMGIAKNSSEQIYYYPIIGKLVK
jgi:hypothetical protein